MRKKNLIKNVVENIQKIVLLGRNKWKQKKVVIVISLIKEFE